MIVHHGFKVICDKYRKVIIGEKLTNKVKVQLKKVSKKSDTKKQPIM